MKKATAKNADNLIREKISQTLKEKWQDPNFRNKMIHSIQQRERKVSLSQTQKEKISEAMKKKWQESEFRMKAMLRRTATSPHDKDALNSSGSHAASVANVNVSAATTSSSSGSRKRVTASSRNSESSGIIALTPLKTTQTTPSNVKSRNVNDGESSTASSGKKKKSKPSSSSSSSTVVMVQALTPNSNKPLSIDMNEKISRSPRVGSDGGERSETRLRLDRMDSLSAYMDQDDERFDDDFVFSSR